MKDELKKVAEFYEQETMRRIRKTITVTLCNDFHRTQVNVRLRFDGQRYAYLSRSQMNRVRRALCPFRSENKCRCGIIMGRQPDPIGFDVAQDSDDNGIFDTLAFENPGPDYEQSIFQPF